MCSEDEEACPYCGYISPESLSYAADSNARSHECEGDDGD